MFKGLAQFSLSYIKNMSNMIHIHDFSTLFSMAKQLLLTKFFVYSEYCFWSFLKIYILNIWFSLIVCLLTIYSIFVIVRYSDVTKFISHCSLAQGTSVSDIELVACLPRRVDQGFGGNSDMYSLQTEKGQCGPTETIAVRRLQLVLITLTMDVLGSEC